jgi:23S rRNA pseudouridine1911/1915/1917 synthase
MAETIEMISSLEEPERLDAYLGQNTELSRSRIADLIRESSVYINGKTINKPSFKLRGGERIAILLPETLETGIEPENIPLDILYQDEDIAVVNKPSGLVVHPAAGNEHGTLVNALLYAVKDLSGIGGEIRPGIVHRLDKDTSGVLVVAKNDKAHNALCEQFKTRSLEKHYRAVVDGKMKEEGRIEAPIGRDPRDRKRMAVVENGRPSVTEWKVLTSLKGASYVDVHLLTGRTHQIRVHMKSIGHPVLGDRIYAPNLKTSVHIERLMLHAYSLCFHHPSTNEEMTFFAPLPGAFGQLIEKLL